MTNFHTNLTRFAAAKHLYVEGDKLSVSDSGATSTTVDAATGQAMQRFLQEHSHEVTAADLDALKKLKERYSHWRAEKPVIQALETLIHQAKEPQYMNLETLMGDKTGATQFSENFPTEPFSRKARINKATLDLQLFEAIKDGSIEDLKRLLAMGASPNHHSSLRAAPIYYAAYYGHVVCIECLLDFGADWNVPNARWFTPHLIAFLERHTKVAELLAARGSVLESDDAHGWTSLHRAAYFRDDERILKLVSQGFSIHALTSRSETPLHLAAKGGSNSCVKHLLDLKANVMARQKNGSSVLHCASEGGLLPLIRLCLENDISVNEADKGGWQPIHCAARYASSEAVQYLLQNGADGNAKTIHGLVPVHLSAIHGDVQSLQALVEWGAQLDALSGKKRTPLHYAAQSNSVACALFCLSKGIDMEVKDAQWQRALEVAADYGSFQVLTALLVRCSKLKHTPSLIASFFQAGDPLSLKLAVDGGHAECVGALLDAGAVSYPEGLLQGTSFEAAMAYGSDCVLKEFVKRLHRLYDFPIQNKQESYRRAAQFFSNYEQEFPSLSGGPNIKEMVKSITACEETENDFVPAVLHLLRESEHTVHVEEKEINPLEETALKNGLPFFLSLDSTREAIKRASCKVLIDLFRRFHEKNTSEKYRSNDSLKHITDERRALLDPSQVEKKFGDTIRQGIDEWMAFLVDPSKTSKGYMLTRYGYTPLHFAALRSSGEIVQSHLERGLSVHVRTDEGLTPLHFAALGGKLENMQLLHEAGALMSAKTDRGTTVLQCAALGGTVSCVKLCLTEGSACDERNGDGWRALHFASLGGSAPVINFLRSEGALMNEPSDMVSQWLGPSGRLTSPLIHAIKRGHADCVKALISGGVNPRQKDGGTEIPLEYALKYGSKDILHVFFKSMYRCFFPINAKVEEARLALYTRLAQLQKSVSTLRVEDVLPLLADDTLAENFVPAVLSELNTKLRNSSPAFDDFSGYELRRMLETPKVVDVVTTYIMKRLKALCKKLCDADERSKGQTGYVCMSSKRRALLSFGTLDDTIRPLVHAGIEERFAKHTRRVRGPLSKEGSHGGELAVEKQQLLEAVKNGLNREVVRLLHKGVSPDMKVAGRLTALPFAVYYGHTECAQTLMNEGADWNAPFLYDYTPQKLAILKNNVETAELFSVRESRVETSDRSDWSTLHWASLFGDITLIKVLLDPQGDNINCCTNEGLTPLHLAAIGGSQTCVDYLIKQGADVMARQNSGLSLLHCAAEGGLTSLVDHCLKKGFSISVSSGEEDWHPIHSAARFGSSKMISYLLSRGADVNAQTDAGMSPLHLAALGGNSSNMRTLVEWGADCKAFSESEQTTLHLAAEGGSVDCVTYCFSHGLTHDLCDCKGWRPLDYAAYRGSSDVLKLLLSKESALARSFERPLRLAFKEDHAECVKLLLDAGANPMIGTLNEETPFECAMKYGSLSIVETFMQCSYKLLCPHDLEVGNSRICIDRARNQQKYNKLQTTIEKVRFLIQSEIADKLAGVILAYLNRNQVGDHDLARIAGLSAEETNCLLKMNETKELVENYLVDQLSSLCEKLCSTHVNKTGDDNSQELEATRRKLFTRESIKEVFGRKMRQEIKDQFDRVLPAQSKAASSKSYSRGTVVNLGRNRSSSIAVSPDQDKKILLKLELYEALKTGSVEIVKELLVRGASPDHHSCQRIAPLFYAAYYGHVEGVKALFDHGADRGVTYAGWLTPHQIAFQEGHNDVAQLFAAQGSELKDDDHGWTPLHRAALFRDDERVLSLVSQSSSVNDLTEQGETPLHIAAQSGSLSCVKHLLSMKANLMARQHDGSTVLHCASAGGVLPLIGLCLEKGLKLYGTDKKGWQPIHHAARHGSSEAVLILLINGADANAQTFDGLRPVDLAAFQGNVLSFKVLVDYGAQLSVVSERGRTPLHHAVLSHSTACIQYCLTNGVDTQVQDKEGCRAIDIAAARGALEVLIMLLKHGDPVHPTQSHLMGGLFKRPNELSPLLLAINGNHVECVRALLDAGAESFCDNLHEVTPPLDAALSYGSRVVIEAFIERICRIHYPPSIEKRASCERITEFFDAMSSLRKKYATLAKMDINIQLKIITSLDETEYELARTIIDKLIQSECVPNLGSNKGDDLLESISEVDLTKLLDQDVTREAVKKYLCRVVQSLLHRFHKKNDAQVHLNEPQFDLTRQERRRLLDPNQVEENFGSLIRRGIDEWITFLENPIKPTKMHMRTRYGYTPLHYAAMRSSAEQIRSLLEQGLSTVTRTNTEDDVTPLHLAALYGKRENMIVLHKTGIPLMTTTKRGITVLHCAAFGGSVECVEYCLENGCDIDKQNHSGVRPLHYAAFGGSEDVIKLLFSKGALMNEPSSTLNQWLGPPVLSSPLFLAIKGGFVGCVKALLESGSDPRRVEHRTEIPFECALKYASDEIIDVLINSCDRCFCPTRSQLEKARMTISDSFRLWEEQGIPISFEQVLTLVSDPEPVKYFVQVLLGEMNMEMFSNSSVFHHFFSNKFRKLYEAPEVIDAVTTYLMTELKTVCNKLCDLDDVNQKDNPSECMTKKRRALLDPEKLDEIFRLTVHTGIEERFLQLTCKLKELEHGVDSDEGALGTKREQLLEAVKNGMEHEVVRLLEKGVSPNEMVAGQLRALPYAVYYGHKECVQRLIHAGALWDAPLLHDFLNDFTPHELAVLKNNVEIAELFSARGSLIEPAICPDWQALHWAALFGDIEGLRMLISQGTQIDCRTDGGLTPLHLAALGGSQTCSDYLIEQGADMHMRQKDGLTLLHCAVEGDLTALVDRCIKEGLSVSVKSHKEPHPIHTAARYGTPKMISYLLSRKADVHTLTDAGMSPLHLAAVGGNINNMLKLVEWGSKDLNALSESKMSVLHLAAIGGSVECTSYCLSHGLSHKKRDRKGLQALHYAAQYGTSDVLELLLTKEVPNSKRFDMPLRLAIVGDHPECVKLLLDAGGDPMESAFDEETPFEYTMRYGSRSIIETFMQYSYTILCPNELDVGTSRVNVAKALESFSRQPTHHYPPSIIQKISFLMKRNMAGEVARLVLRFLNTYRRDDVQCIAGFSEEETIDLLQLDEVKDIVGHYLVEQLTIRCGKCCAEKVDNAKDDNSDNENSHKTEPNPRELFTRESIQKDFGGHIRRGLDEQFSIVVHNIQIMKQLLYPKLSKLLSPIQHVPFFGQGIKK